MVLNIFISALSASSAVQLTSPGERLRLRFFFTLISLSSLGSTSRIRAGAIRAVDSTLSAWPFPIRRHKILPAVWRFIASRSSPADQRILAKTGYIIP